MKVLLINGSPNKNGCTNRALEEVASTLNEEGIDTEIFWIGNKPIGGCIGCHNCVETKKCFMDDVVNEVASKLEEFDGFIFGSPVHYSNIAGNMKSFMDRLFYSARKSNLIFKPASVVCSARRAGTTDTYDALIKYLGISQMPIISSRYWNMVHGSTPEDVERDLEGMQAMRMLGRNMAYYIKAIDIAKKNGLELPKRETVTLTNFIEG